MREWSLDEPREYLYDNLKQIIKVSGARIDPTDFDSLYYKLFMWADAMLSTPNIHREEEVAPVFLYQPQQLYTYIRQKVWQLYATYKMGEKSKDIMYENMSRDSRDTIGSGNSDDEVTSNDIWFIKFIKPLLNELSFDQSFIFHCRMPARFSYQRSEKKNLLKCMWYEDIALLMKELWLWSEASSYKVRKIYMDILEDIKEYLEERGVTVHDFRD